jgi:hypothetical protein
LSRSIKNQKSKIKNQKTLLVVVVVAVVALDKEATSYNDIFDAFRLALKFYHFENSSE